MVPESSVGNRCRGGDETGQKGARGGVCTAAVLLVSKRKDMDTISMQNATHWQDSGGGLDMGGGRGLQPDWWVNLGNWENSKDLEAAGVNSFKW